MAQANLSPRQKMINMMYIVLTALLALNVSVEVLEAFVNIDKSIEHNIQIVRAKNKAELTNFQTAVGDNEAKVGPWFALAQGVAEETQKLYQYIQDLKIELVITGDGKKTKAIADDKMVNPMLIGALEDTDASSRLMIGDKNSGEAFGLREKLKVYRDFVTANIDPQRGASVINSIEELLKTDDGFTKDGETRSWEVGMFDGVPLIAAVTNLTKMQLDLYNVESEAITFFAKEVNASDFKFSEVDVAVVPSSNYVVRGSEFTAEVFLMAYDPTQRPVLHMGGGQTIQSNERGKIIYKTIPQELGQRAFSGEISVMTANGEIRRPVQWKYTVVNPNTVISPTRMNVLYRGIENPVSISASGASHERMEVYMSNANWSRQGDTYIVIPGEGRTCEISVKVDGKQLDQPQAFRVKDLPLPMPVLDGISSKTVSKNELQASQGIRAEMPRDFEFDLKYRVTSFRVFATIDGYTEEEASQSAAFTDKQRRILGLLRSGQRVSFIEIKAAGPDGKTVELLDISVKIK